MAREVRARNGPQAALERARNRGYLRIGSARADERLEEEWVVWCREKGRDCLVVQSHGDTVSLRVEVCPRHPLSPLAQQELNGLMQRAPGGFCQAGEFALEGLPRRELNAWLRQVQDLLARDRTGRLVPEPLAEGRARCTDNTGYEDVLEVGDLVYLRELPNLPGYCLVVRHLDAPLLGLPCDRFELVGG